jgi:hypothetical protein
MSNFNLMYRFLDASGWHSQIVDSAGKAGWATSLALDEDGYPRISYRDHATSDLKYSGYVELQNVYLPLILCNR